jgi:coproporphyrinogen III oxidase-like Fe-S oxidoreductase
MTAYVDLVCAEIRATKRLGQQPLETVSFGGGVSTVAVESTSPSETGL